MHENEDIISIIVPIFNSEKYLSECIDSILAQTYSNIEVILINDGSSDGSESICQNYVDEDKRIRYLSQTNQGVSAARNNGIKNSCGKYLMFVDSDDTIAENTVETLYYKAIENDAQCVIGGMIQVKNGEYVRNGFGNKVVTGHEEIARMLAKCYLTSVASSPCCKLYLKKTVADIRFRDGIALGEDLLFNINFFDSADKVVLINEELYYYRLENDSSLTNTYKDGYYEDMRLIYEEAMGFFKRIEYESKTVINKSNVGYKFYNFAVAFIVRQIERRDSKESCKKYIRAICNDQTFIEAVDLIKESSCVDRLMVWLIKQKRIGLIYNAAVIRSKIRGL